MKYTAIVLAAGNGSRMKLGYNKMFYTLNNKPIILLSMQKFLNDLNCTQLIIVVNEKEQDSIRFLLTKFNALNDKCIIVNGSSERQKSVYNGLKEVNNEIVLIHDGARPFITKTLIQSLVEEAKKYGCAIPGVKVKDTIKYVENDFITKTIPREFLYAVQTPQACETKSLKIAQEQAKKEGYLATDEASLIEKYMDFPVKIVESSYENIKITTQDDLIFAEKLYNKYFN